MSSLTNDLPFVCFLGLRVLFSTHSWLTWELLSLNFGSPWSLVSTVWTNGNRNSAAGSPFHKQFPHLQRRCHGPLDAILHVRGWTLVARMVGPWSHQRRGDSMHPEFSDPFSTSFWLELAETWVVIRISCGGHGKGGGTYTRVYLTGWPHRHKKDLSTWRLASRTS